MPYVTGYLNIIEAGRPDQGLPGGQGGYPSNELPGQPAYPSQGPGFPTHPIAPGGGGGGPNYPSQGPGFPTNPIAPGGMPNLPSNELPAIPGIWPPPSPAHPIVPLPPDQELPPGIIWPPIAPPNADGKYVVIVFIPGVGYRYTVIDTTLKPGNALPGGANRPSNELPGSQPRPDQGLPPNPARPDQGLPSTPQPKKS